MSAPRDSLSKEDLVTLTDYLTTKSYEQGLADGQIKASSNDPLATIVAPPEGADKEPRFRVIDQELLCRLVKERDALRSQVQHQDVRMEFLRGEIGSLVNDRDALRSVLKEIVKAYDNTYEAELHGDTWRGAASINFRVMERAAALVGAK